MEKYMVMQYLNICSPICKGRTNDLAAAKALRDALATIEPENTFIVVEVLWKGSFTHFG